MQTASASSGAVTPTATFSLESFQTDLFTGGATSEIAIAVPPGAGGVAPVIRLRYNSTPVDDLPQTDQWQGPGLGWTLDLGGFILRNTADDSFRMVYGGRAHDLVLVDSVQKLYRTKDETFVRLRYDTSGGTDYWTLTTKDGAVHRFGYNADSRANAYRPDLVTPVVYKYFLDEVKTASGVAVRYAHAKQTAMVYGTTRVYDRAVYPDLITWAYSGGGAVGATREVRFVRSGTRGDYTDSSAAQGMAFFETQRLDAIEVRVGASLVRRYALAYDYSADRDPSGTWGDGTPGDLTLRTVIVVGSDNASTLPPASFSYTNARLSTASNGLGGSVSFTYEHVQTRPLYSSCEAYQTDELGYVVDCGRWAPSLSADPYGYTVSVGHILSAADWETVPLYRACTSATYPRDEWGNIIGPPSCVEFGLGSAPDGWGFSTLLGHAEGNSIIGMWQLFSACKMARLDEFYQAVGCADWTGATAPDGWGFSTLVGHSYLSALDRYRVSQRLVTDGRGGTVTMAYDYRDLGLSPNGTEFRGHGAVRAIDALGNYTDTWFYQDDFKKGRPYAAETRGQSGALYTRVSSTWSTTNPYPGVTFVRLDRTDAYSYEGGSTAKQTAMTFEYDAYGNRIRAVSLGDVAVSGDERDERTDWAVDTASWLMRPTRVALHDGAGALLREHWLSYDGLGWGSLGARGLLTRDEARLAGARGIAGNPVVTHAYDASGNRTATTDPRGCTTTTTFEDGQVYPASATTCLGHTTTFTHDARFGVRTSLTDPNDQTTTSTYDVFGRLTRVTGPFDTGSTYGSVSTFYKSLGDLSLQRIVTYRTVTYRTEQHGTAEVLWSAQYFDGLGRVYMTQAEGPGGQVIVSETTFDARGLVAQRSAPRFITEGALWTTMTYDALGRPVQVRHPDSCSRARCLAVI
ncbi:MAG: hypothetical protein HYV93_09130 [Candidatus Rokubacteria bacterium]|nr:hypothetical protein [Candidatus Rokubacteria bacterium]